MKQAAHTLLTIIQVAALIYAAGLYLVLAGANPLSGLGPAAFDSTPAIPGGQWLLKMAGVSLCLWATSTAKRRLAAVGP